MEIGKRQLHPVVRALSVRRVSLLIADDVGLGKTIEASPMVQETILRCRVCSLFNRLPILAAAITAKRNAGQVRT